jgi:hypothetical protein
MHTAFGKVSNCLFICHIASFVADIKKVFRLFGFVNVRIWSTAATFTAEDLAASLAIITPVTLAALIRKLASTSRSTSMQIARFLPAGRTLGRCQRLMCCVITTPKGTLRFIVAKTSLTIVFAFPKHEDILLGKRDRWAVF